MLKKILHTSVFIIYGLQAQDPSFQFEGILGSPTENICNLNHNAQLFLPYNPVIVEIGACEGQGTVGLGKTYPYATIYAFEPHPETYTHLRENVKSLNHVIPIPLAVAASKGTAKLRGSGPTATLLPFQAGQSYDVFTVVLDDWCKEQNIDHIDFLRLDTGGLEWQILQSSPHILKEVIVLVIKTYMQPTKPMILSYPLLKLRLENEGFELLSHWYQEDGEGEATFVKKYMYNALFR